MVAGGVPQPDEDHALKVAQMAIAMMRYISEQPMLDETRLDMRIGIHSGPAVAGVIGKKKFVYDLWGDAVNTAGRMESHGEAGKIQVSSATAALLKEKFELQSRGFISIKGKGDLEAFTLLH